MRFCRVCVLFDDGANGNTSKNGLNEWQNIQDEQKKMKTQKDREKEIMKE